MTPLNLAKTDAPCAKTLRSNPPNPLKGFGPDQT